MIKGYEDPRSGSIFELSNFSMGYTKSCSVTRTDVIGRWDVSNINDIPMKVKKSDMMAAQGPKSQMAHTRSVPVADPPRRMPPAR